MSSILVEIYTIIMPPKIPVSRLSIYQNVIFMKQKLTMILICVSAMFMKFSLCTLKAVLNYKITLEICFVQFVKWIKKSIGYFKNVWNVMEIKYVRTCWEVIAFPSKNVHETHVLQRINLKYRITRETMIAVNWTGLHLLSYLFHKQQSRIRTIQNNFPQILR